MRAQWEYELFQYLVQLYGEGQANHLQDRLLGIVENALLHSSATAPQHQNQTETMLICYGDTLIDDAAAPLHVLAEFAESQLDDLFSCIHILPFFPYSSDDGFAVIDYQTVRKDLGDWRNVTRLGEKFDLMFDLVINHCSRENAWFTDFLADQGPGNRFFHEILGHPDLDAVVRPRNTPLLTSVNTTSGPKQVWTTFSDDQVDLNFANPEVLICFTEILCNYFMRGARYIRLDAIAFLWKRIGSNCMSLPETHALVRILRRLIDIVGLPLTLLTETNVPHDENVSYFGDGDEAHMVYQFSLAPLLLYAYLFNDGKALSEWAKDLQPAPDGCSYLNFIATHDGIGLRPLEGLMPESEIRALTEVIHQRGGFSSMRTDANGNEKPYELNVALFSAFGGTSENIDAYVAAHQLLLAFQGVPGIYLNALVASSNDLRKVESTGRLRSINRGQWAFPDLCSELANQDTTHAKVFARLTNSLRIRNKQHAFGAEASQRVICGDAQCLVFLREHETQSILVIASFLNDHHPLQLPQTAELTRGTARDLLTDSIVQLDHSIPLLPHQVLWIELS